MSGVRPRLLLSLPRGRTERALTGGVRLVGGGLLVAIGLIHLVLAPTYSIAAGYIGALFYVTCAVAWLTAAAVLAGVRGAWLVGAATALGAFVGLLLSITVGLPGFTDSLSAPYAILSLVLEAAFVGLYAAAALARRSLLLTPRLWARHPSPT